jgi:hypothetical protein
MKNHPNWHAYEYVCKHFGLSEEYENELNKDNKELFDIAIKL